MTRPRATRPRRTFSRISSALAVLPERLGVGARPPPLSKEPPGWTGLPLLDPPGDLCADNTVPLRTGQGQGLSLPLKAQRAGQEAEVPYTHDHAAVAGIYVTADTCHARVTMAIGHEFPPCPKCGRSTTYTRVEAPKT